MQLHTHHFTAAQLSEGTRVGLRSLGPDDLERLGRFFTSLSPESVYRRFMSPLPRPTVELGTRLLQIDHWEREAVARFTRARWSASPDMPAGLPAPTWPWWWLTPGSGEGCRAF